jgi:hypothetical protein
MARNGESARPLFAKSFQFRNEPCIISNVYANAFDLRVNAVLSRMILMNGGPFKKCIIYRFFSIDESFIFTHDLTHFRFSI